MCRFPRARFGIVGESAYFCSGNSPRTMKRTFAAVLSLLCCAALVAQPSLQVDAPRQWMGEIVYKTPKAVSFRLENTGDEPLLLGDVHPSCGCVDVSFPKHPIPAGSSADITATYDAATLGTFYRELAVYSNASEQPLYLAFEGRVVASPSDVDYEANFPIDLGGVRMNTNVIEFDDVNKGDRPVAELLVLNLKKEDFTPQLMHIPDYIAVDCLPQTIQGGRVGRVRLTLDSDKLLMDGLNQSSIYMSRYPGDKVGLDNELLLTAVLLPSFANLSADEVARAPRIVFTDGADTLTTELTMSLSEGKRKRRDPKITKTIQVTNAGETELSVSALQVMNRAVSVSLGNRTVPAHGTTKLRLTVDLRQLTMTKNRPRVLIICNDPHNAKTILNLNMEE